LPVSFLVQIIYRIVSYRIVMQQNTTGTALSILSQSTVSVLVL